MTMWNVDVTSRPVVRETRVAIFHTPGCDRFGHCGMKKWFAWGPSRRTRDGTSVLFRSVNRNVAFVAAV